MKKLLLLLYVPLALFSCKERSSEVNSSIKQDANIASLTSKLDSIYRQGPIIGFSAAIVTSNKMIYNEGFGYADIENDIKYTPQTIQNIASISKTLIGISLLKAQELGKLNLDDPIQKYLPFKVFNPKYPETPITIRQLATHTSSILDTDDYDRTYVLLDEERFPNEMGFEYLNPAKTKTTFEVFLEKSVGDNGIWNKEESFGNYKPGSMYEYSNVAATLAALIIEKTTGMTFNDFTKKHILQPLQMNATGWNTPEVDVTKRSRGFINKDTLIAKYELITYPDGGLITSTEDLSIYLMELMKGQSGSGTLLTTESYSELFKKQLSKEQLPEDSQDDNSGIFMEFGNRGIGHSGGEPGVATFMYFNPETELGKILFINTDFEEDRSVIDTFKALWKTLGAFEKKFQEEK